MRNALVSNVSLGPRGFRLGLDAFIIRNDGCGAISIMMMAKTFEAIVGAVYIDTGDNALKSVHDVLELTGFFEYPLLMVTFCDSPHLDLINIQMITNVRTAILHAGADLRACTVVTIA
ncbi:hypothetical protein EJ02DRAFT_132375 [Clathrospora elynae]|uniref:RNase III domain-containing protein n=1 Tax=Clathrospora elynae TaxID=706981 RepID=A0A6A5S6E4_9PLEO|nr:hypothetical protein EJ02DRAFT_132375 [Clathrospora elynae]